MRASMYSFVVYAFLNRARFESGLALLGSTKKLKGLSRIFLSDIYIIEIICLIFLFRFQNNF